MASLHNNTGAEEGPKNTRLIAHARTSGRIEYLPLLVPIILFLSGQYIPPRINLDAIAGFLALRGMMDGGAFNCIAAPDPANIASNLVTFLTLWSPGQYLVPGFFIWLGTNYGLAVSLTALIATLIGVLGWIRVARSFAVSSFVLFVFVLGLNTFIYVTYPFRVYNGGEVLLFAAAPWSLYAMRRTADQSTIYYFPISLLSLALLFFMKLTGLVIFAANVAAISLFALIKRRWLGSSVITMWVAAAVGAVGFVMFWMSRGPVAASGSAFRFSWFPIWFSLSGAAFSGISGIDFLGWFVGHPWVRTIFDIKWASTQSFSYVLGPLGLLLMVWVWIRLRNTRYREMAFLLLTVILMYMMALAAMYLQGAAVWFEERHFRYAGILFFLLLLTAIDQWRVRFAKGLAWTVVIVLGLYGLKDSATRAYAQISAGYYDPMIGIYQDIVPPAVLEYMRSEMKQQDLQRPIAVIPSLLAALSLPQFRNIYIDGQYLSVEEIAAHTWHGRGEKIFVVVQKEMLLNGKAEAILRSFISYKFDKWNQKKLQGMVIYTQ